MAEYFDPISAVIYLGGQVRPAVSLSSSAPPGLTMEDDCILTYGPNNVVGDDAGYVDVTGKGNTDAFVRLYFDIYTGIKVYVLEDGSGNTYSDWTLSDFSASSGRSLFDLSSMVSGDLQTARLSVDNNPGYQGMTLGIMVRDLTGTPALGEGSNELDEYLVLTVGCGGETQTFTLSDATDGLIPLLTISDGDDIPVEITLSLPSDVSGDHVQGMSLSLTLAVGVYFSQQGI